MDNKEFATKIKHIQADFFIQIIKNLKQVTHNGCQEYNKAIDDVINLIKKYDK
jgi:hypothetical protein